MGIELRERRERGVDKKVRLHTQTEERESAAAQGGAEKKRERE